MIAGIGTDIIEIGRVTKACQSKHFLERIFTEEEQKLIQKRPEAAASDFAVKEAASKALGTGFSGFGPKDIEVRRDASGAPYVKMYGGAEALSREKKIKRWHVTVSHTDALAAAVVVAEG